MKLTDLDREERLVLGSLVRLVVAADDRFSILEQLSIHRVGERYGSLDILAGAISDSSTRLIEVDAIREAAMKLSRREARLLIVAIMDEIAACDGIVPREQALLLRIRQIWADTPEAGPYR